MSAVLIVVLALQGFGLPNAWAASIVSHSSPASACPHHDSDGTQKCPCCPDGAAMVAGCITLCSSAAGVIALHWSPPRATSAARSVFVARIGATQTYAPPTPPPIG